MIPRNLIIRTGIRTGMRVINEEKYNQVFQSLKFCIICLIDLEMPKEGWKLYYLFQGWHSKVHFVYQVKTVFSFRHSLLTQLVLVAVWLVGNGNVYLSLIFVHPTQEFKFEDSYRNIGIKSQDPDLSVCFSVLSVDLFLTSHDFTVSLCLSFCLVSGHDRGFEGKGHHHLKKTVTYIESIVLVVVVKEVNIGRGGKRY